MKRRCDNCGNVYTVDKRNFNRGWGRACDKSCAAILRERGKRNVFASPLFKAAQAAKAKQALKVIEDERKAAIRAQQFLGSVEKLKFNKTEL